jgi:hypothetical protein
MKMEGEATEYNEKVNSKELYLRRYGLDLV